LAIIRYFIGFRHPSGTLRASWSLFRELDAHIPMSDVETIKSKQPSVDVYTYNADRGFQCDERDSFAPEAAQIAWGRTLRFIDRPYVRWTSFP
jgi:dienelactone hydrolase